MEIGKLTKARRKHPREKECNVMIEESNKQTSDKDEKQPEVISKDEADAKNDYAQSLEDEITHKVDYGGLNEEKEKK